MAFWGKNSSDNTATGSGSAIAGSLKSAGFTLDAQSGKTQEPASCEGDLLLSRFGKIRSALSAGTVIQGKLSFDMPVSIDGKLSGEIFSSDVLIVGASAVIDAQLDVASLVVCGTVRGVINASQRVELMTGGRIEGEVITPVFKMEESSVFEGKCSMPARPLKAVGGSSNEKQH